MTTDPKFRRAFDNVDSWFCWHPVKDEEIKQELKRCYAIIDAAVDLASLLSGTDPVPEREKWIIDVKNKTREFLEKVK